MDKRRPLWLVAVFDSRLFEPGSDGPKDRKTMEAPERPWSVPVSVADIPEDGRHYDLVADQEVRQAVAKISGLRALSKLDASFDLERRGDTVTVRGEVHADVGQTCVVTLDPIDTQVSEAVDLEFVPPADDAVIPAKGGREPPEPLENGIVDLGAVATEFLILGLDPYPRKPGVEFSPPAAGDEAEKPFAALAALKKRS
ncbi:MAG: DUF177 domain-containing protein [Pseudolabrys sp.]|nr:DUF177 domain-containing protein [Pseudolabrys sp.]